MTQGAGTPFAYQGKWCLAYGLHTGRLVPGDRQVYAHFKDLPPEKRGVGNFRAYLARRCRCVGKDESLV